MVLSPYFQQKLIGDLLEPIPVAAECSPLIGLLFCQHTLEPENGVFPSWSHFLRVRNMYFLGEGVWDPKPENEQMSRKRIKTKEEPKRHMSTLGSRLFTIVLPQQQWTSLLAVLVILFNAHYEHRGQSY